MTPSNTAYNWPLTFEIVATAVAFSPSAKANLFESVRIANMLNARMVFIHVGEKNPESEKKMESILAEVGIDENKYIVAWKQGDPTLAILEATQENCVDLLIAGAMQKENLAQYFKGSVARKLCRKAECSLLLLTHPAVESRRCDNIVVNGLDHPKTSDSIKMAIYMANAFKSKNLTIVEEVEPKQIKHKGQGDIDIVKANREKANIARQEKSRLHSFLNEVPKSNDLVIKDKCIFGKSGYTIGHFAEKNNVDLLVLNSPDSNLGLLDRVFTHNIEYILSDLPSDLLIVHTTKAIVNGST